VSNIADTIKQTLSMEDVARHYGYPVSRSGSIKCPFHNDKTASLKIYSEPGRGWHCYGACNEGDSVIDFVMKVYGLQFRDAVVRVNADFHLGLTDDRPDPAETAQRNRERDEAVRIRATFETEYAARSEQHRRLWFAKIHKAPKDPDDEYDPEYVEACKGLDALDDWFSTHHWKDR